MKKNQIVAPPTLPGKLTKVGWLPPKRLSFDDWRAAIGMFKYIEGSSQWWIGDGLLIGEKTKPWGKMYAEAVDELGFDYGSARDAKWVAESFQLSRRRDKLSWSHHREVAGLAPRVADRLLAKAEREGLSRGALRQLVKQMNRSNLRLPSRALRNDVRLLNCDLNAAEIEPGSIDHIITDPPYPWLAS